MWEVLEKVWVWMDKESPLVCKTIFHERSKFFKHFVVNNSWKFGKHRKHKPIKKPSKNGFFETILFKSLSITFKVIRWNSSYCMNAKKVLKTTINFWFLVNIFVTFSKLHPNFNGFISNLVFNRKKYSTCVITNWILINKIKK